MGIFTEEPNDWEPDKPYTRGSLRDLGHVPGRDFHKAREAARDEHCHVLRGLHNQSGNWVILLRLEGEDAARAALRACYGSSQPDVKQAVIMWDHFSAFKVDTLTTVTFMRDPR